MKGGGEQERDGRTYARVENLELVVVHGAPSLSQDLHLSSLLLQESAAVGVLLELLEDFYTW